MATNGVQDDTTPVDQPEEEEEEHDEIGEEVDLAALGVTDQPIKKKKKRKKNKPKSKRGLDKPTGFEEYYVDPPMTPEEYEENRTLYDPILPFVDRILTAIQHFERTRKLHPQRRDVFYKYLAYGSIDVGPNMFQTLDPKAEATQEMDKDALAAAMARTSIAAHKRENMHLYAVDFTGCVAGFLSRRAGDWFGLDTPEQVRLVTTTLERFMDYLMQHDVCPEYGEDVLEARNLCRRASGDIWRVAEAQRKLPGDFNVACSTLFAGQYARDYDGVTDWSVAGTDLGGGENGQAQPPRSFVGFTQEKARQIVSLGIAGGAEEDVYQDFMRRVNDGTLRVVVKRERTGFEITRIQSPSRECKDLYRKESRDFQPVGRVSAKRWDNPERPPEDLTAEEELERKLQKSTAGTSEEEYAFLVEGTLQTYLTVGMKVEATLHRLNCGAGGLWFFDELIRCYPPFDRYLENELMVGWKEPRAVKGATGYVDREGNWILFGEGEGPDVEHGDGTADADARMEGKDVVDEDGAPAGVV